ncbi:hypothetical protein BJY04DRAFT_217504 [Aspergillus karnatakaensis]|uniref:uncharacterized protein n=1 Tax=Aspergillus karnatakaensis TaxID=1810916 RepID=UPI003CCE31A3
MGEPFAAAGSAVGVISLGLQVSKGLISYFHEYKGSGEEISHLSFRIIALQETLDAISAILPDAQARGTPALSDYFKIAQRRIEECENIIHELDEMLKDAKIGSPPSASGMKGAMTRVRYPFRRPALLEMLHKVEGLQQNLHTALLTLQL